MRSTLIMAASIATALLIGPQAVALRQPGGPPAASTVLKHLKIGQPVALKNEGTRYSLTTYLNGPEQLSHSVVGLADDHVVVRDVAEITDIAIPIWSIKSIRTMRIPQPQ